MAPSPTAADLLVRRLKEYGVRVVFGYPGGQTTPIYDALARSRDILVTAVARSPSGARSGGTRHRRAGAPRRRLAKAVDSRGWRRDQCRRRGPATPTCRTARGAGFSHAHGKVRPVLRTSA